MNMTFLKLSALIRTSIYFYSGLVSAILTILYYRAYWKFKTTPIIKSLKIFLLTLSIFLFYLTLVSISFVLSPEKYNTLVAFLFIPAFLLAIGITGFYLKSTDDTKDSKKSGKIK